MLTSPLFAYLVSGCMKRRVAPSSVAIMRQAVTVSIRTPVTPPGETNVGRFRPIIALNTRRKG
jgi:hypothetical protein